jgi:predicted alpha/beta hydrolase family esterase
MKLIKTKSFQLAINTKGNPSAKKLAICLPGRLDTKDYISFTSHLEFFSQKGFYAISFDPPGTWESPGSLDLFTTTNYIQAVNEVIAYFSDKQTILLGHSRGGQVAILAGAKNPAVVGLILINASYGPPSPPESKEIVGEVVLDYRDFPPGNSKASAKKEFHLPLNYFRDGAKYDPQPMLINCIKPKLVIFSTNDEFTEPEEVNKIYEKIPEPKMLYELHTEHDYRYDRDKIEEINTSIGVFLGKYFKDL